MREKTFFHTNHKDDREFQSLCRVQCHKGYSIFLIAIILRIMVIFLFNKSYVFQKFCNVWKFDRHKNKFFEMQNAGHKAVRIVLGDWYEQGSVLRWDERGFELAKLRSENAARNCLSGSCPLLG